MAPQTVDTVYMSQVGTLVIDDLDDLDDLDGLDGRRETLTGSSMNS